MDEAKTPAAPEPGPLEFGWFLPTAGDATRLGDRTAHIPASMELFDRVIAAAESSGFEYLLVPINTDTCNNSAAG